MSLIKSKTAIDLEKYLLYKQIFVTFLILGVSNMVKNDFKIT